MDLAVVDCKTDIFLKHFRRTHCGFNIHRQHMDPIPLWHGNGYSMHMMHLICNGCNTIIDSWMVRIWR